MTPLARPSSPSDAVFADREFGFTRRDFERIVEILHAEAGICLSETKAPLVYSRLVKRLRSLGIQSFARYCELVASGRGAAERERMLAALTTNVTSFFREPHHFEHLKTDVLADLIADARAGRRLRFWSAGCSTGEEPYSIALSILELMPEAAELDVRVLATDINASVLAHARAGEFDARTLQPVGRRLRAQWFTASRGQDGAQVWRAGEALSKLVAFRQLNLLAPWPMRADYQAIFCRNVLIYFDAETQSELHQRFVATLSRGGVLYLGASERLKPAAGLRPDGVTTYRRRAAPAPIDAIDAMDRTP